MVQSALPRRDGTIRMTLRPAQVIFRDSLRREAARVRAVLGVAA